MASTGDLQLMEVESESIEQGMGEQDILISEEEIQQAAAPAQRFSLKLLETIRTAQSQNGLKHGDFSRYRCACGCLCVGVLDVLETCPNHFLEPSPSRHQTLQSLHANLKQVGLIKGRSVFPD